MNRIQVSQLINVFIFIRCNVGYKPITLGYYQFVVHTTKQMKQTTEIYLQILKRIL